MAEAAAARREARRKRILENSHNRLQFISGKTGDDSLKEPLTNIQNVDQNNEQLVTSTSSGSCLTSLSSAVNGVIVTEPESHALLSAVQDFIAAGDGEATSSDLAAFETPAPAPELIQPKSLWEKLIAYKYDVVLLSLLIQLLYTLSLFTFDTTYFFLPLIIYIVTKLIWIPAESKSNLASVFLLMNGISANRANNIMNVTQWFGVISQDVCVYLFTTICVQSLVFFFNHLVT